MKLEPLHQLGNFQGCRIDQIWFEKKSIKYAPEGAPSPRARRSLGDMAAYPSSEAGFRPRGAGADRFGGPPRLLRAVGPCHRSVIVLGVIYDLWARLCFVICERKWVSPSYLGDPMVVPGTNPNRQGSVCYWKFSIASWKNTRQQKVIDEKEKINHFSCVV
jgi:hypothetical protein